MSAKFPWGGAGPFLARSLIALKLKQNSLLTCPSQLPHMAQLHLGSTHVRIRPLNSLKLVAVLSSLGKLFHTRADSNLNYLCPYVTVLTVGILTLFSYLKEFLQKHQWIRVSLISYNSFVRSIFVSLIISFNYFFYTILDSILVRVYCSEHDPIWKLHTYCFQILSRST